MIYGHSFAYTAYYTHSKSTDPAKLAHELSTFEDAPHVYIAPGTTGQQKTGLLVVYTLVQENHLVDCHIPTHCTPVFTVSFIAA